ncbi:MAG: hypothetical protein HY520_03910 [Candidatus Aenigmarchaeota archaeon]|nr:hypothetical protein [Candidatus Aenigmarchaeota archaeon]
MEHEFDPRMLRPRKYLELFRAFREAYPDDRAEVLIIKTDENVWRDSLVYFAGPAPPSPSRLRNEGYLVFHHHPQRGGLLVVAHPNPLWSPRERSGDPSVVGIPLDDGLFSLEGPKAAYQAFHEKLHELATHYAGEGIRTIHAEILDLGYRGMAENEAIRRLRSRTPLERRPSSIGEAESFEESMRKETDLILDRGAVGEFIEGMLHPEFPGDSSCRLKKEGGEGAPEIVLYSNKGVRGVLRGRSLLSGDGFLAHVNKSPS